MSLPPLGFQWDPEKERRNVQHHGIDFNEAAKIFRGPTVETLDDRHDYGEDRINALGFADGRPLNVTFCERGEDIRIISARAATTLELRKLETELGLLDDPPPTPDS